MLNLGGWGDGGWEVLWAHREAPGLALREEDFPEETVSLI